MKKKYSIPRGSEVCLSENFEAPGSGNCCPAIDSQEFEARQGLPASISKANLLPEATEGKNQPFEISPDKVGASRGLSRRKLLGALAGLGVLSVLDNACDMNDGIKSVPIGFEPFMEGEKKVWTGPEIPISNTQLNEFLNQVLPAIFGNDGSGLLDTCKFELHDSRLQVSCNKVPIEKPREINNLIISCSNNEIYLSNENWNIYLLHVNNTLRIGGRFEETVSDETNPEGSKSGGQVENKYINHIEYICDADGNFGYFDSEGRNYVELVDDKLNVNRFFVRDCATALRFLSKCDNPEFLEAFINMIPRASKPFDLSGFSDDLQIRELLRLVPERMQNKLILAAFVYKDLDRGDNLDTYRSLQDILRSGWGDCDDYCVANSVWAIAHGHEPYVVHLDEMSSGGCARVIGEHTGGHVLVYYKTSVETAVVCDNTVWSVLGAGVTIFDYIKKTWPEYFLHNHYKLQVYEGKMAFEL